MTSCSSLVEIKCEETLAFYTGYVKDVDRDQVLVAYEGGWQRDAWLSIHSIRPSLSGFHPAQFLPSPGDVVEVKAKSAEHEPYSWWRGSVKSVRANPAALESDELPDSLGSNNRALIYEISYAGWENEFTETLEKEMLRPFNKHPCFSSGEIEKHSLPIAPQLVGMLSQEVLGPVHFDARTLAIIVEPAGTVPHVAPQNQGFVPPPQPITQPRIQVIGEKQACQRAVILLAQLLPRLLHQLEQQQAAQQAQQHAYMQQHDRPSYTHSHDHRSHDRFDSHSGHRDPLATHHHKQPLPQSHHHAYQHQHQQHHNQHDGFGHQMQRGAGDDAFAPSHHYPSSSLPYAGINSSSPPLSLTFHCPPQLMGMVIGKRHKNLYIAENLEGIHKVHVDTETGNIVVIARTMEAAQAARSLLELTEQTLHIPSVLVGRVVGKNFQTIKTIEQHSGVLRIKVGDDRDADMEALQQMALHGIPGLSNVDEQGNPLPNPAALALQAAQANAEKETKRSAFDRPYQYHRGDRRGGGRDGRGGRDDEPEEFDIVALEDDKTVEISIIGSPATVSEAELLLRTHIGLITQIYKLSYDEAMLERQVHALNQICPVKLMLGGDARSGGYGDRQYDDNGRDSRSGGGFMHQGRGRGGERGHGHGGRSGGHKDDKFMPAWMNDNPAPGQGQQQGAGNDGGQQRRRQAADPSVDIHAARLQGAGGAGAGMGMGATAGGQMPMPMQSSGPSYKSAALIGASTVAAGASSAAPSAGQHQQQQPSSSAAAPNGATGGGDDGSGDDDDGSGVPRRRGGRKEKEKQQRRDQRTQRGSGNQNQQGAAADGQQQQQQQRGRGRGNNNRRQNDNNGGAAAGAAAAAPVGGQ